MNSWVLWNEANGNGELGKESPDKDQQARLEGWVKGRHPGGRVGKSWSGIL